MRPVFLVAAALAAESGNATPGDANRLRRMDRFGRSGFLAGTHAFAASGVPRPSDPDARSGVIVGTRHGCRPAITEHAARLAGAARVEDLAPSVFAATVHNSVNGELAMALGLGGVSETIVSGRTSGLEALILGARRVASGDTDRMLVVAAEGVDDATREAWAEERSALGRRAAGVELVETGVSVLLEAGEREEEIALEERFPARYVADTLFFEPDARRAKARFFEWVREVDARAGGDARPAAVSLCAPDYEDFLEGEEGGGGDAPRIERFGAGGMYEIARDIAARRAQATHLLPPRSPSKKTRVYVTRDVTGAVAAVALEFF
ncbi:MAG TPA: beta-ketoacyl synthase N-terminal-like domain-containing protein [Thermoanaerobaculia bacterium]|nr:beta-ketoacyl synthase N-terminal-like domain-containing protein [Thermoanaerobaculia bacterium]